MGIADTCAKEIELSEEFFVNLTNSKLHKGRADDSGLTGCGNPIGANIVTMTVGSDDEEVDPKFICKLCFGRSLEERAAVARRLSRPTEPLRVNLQTSTIVL